MGLLDAPVPDKNDFELIDTFRDEALLRSGRFHQHMDGSIVCNKCNLTLKEGCKHAKVRVCFR